MKILLLFLISLNLFAVDYRDYLADGIKNLEKINSTSAMDQCNEKESKVSEACLKRYRQLYSDSILNISIGFGYFDHNYPIQTVHDVSMRAAFVEALISKNCRPNISACGFSRDPDDADKLYKEVINPWGKPHKIEITLTSGALSGNNKSNTEGFNLNRQQKKCELATKTFMSNISRGDEVILYVGHSREGGGPDFCPPRLLADGHRDYPHYKAKRVGHNQMLEALEQARSNGKSPEIIGMLSCKTYKHFFSDYASRAKNAGYIMSHADTYSSDQLINLFGTVQSVLSQKCVEGFVPSVASGKAMKLKNMFTQEIP